MIERRDGELVKPMEGTPSAFINKLVEDALKKLPQQEQRISFAKALHMSIKLDQRRTGCPCPCSPQQIYEVTGFHFDYQKESGICLGKADAIDFLRKFGVTSVKPAGFKRRNTKQRYKSVFKRNASVIKGSHLIATYAEWLHLENFEFEPYLPKEILSLLPEGWENPPGINDESDS